MTLTLRFATFLGLVHLVFTAHIPRQRDALSIQVPSVAPQNISDKVDPDFLGLAFEQASWTRYAMNDDGELNEFSANLISDIYRRTGGKPIIRLVSSTYSLDIQNTHKTPGRNITRLRVVHSRAKGARFTCRRAG